MTYISNYPNNTLSTSIFQQPVDFSDEYKVNFKYLKKYLDENEYKEIVKDIFKKYLRREYLSDRECSVLLEEKLIGTVRDINIDKL